MIIKSSYEQMYKLQTPRVTAVTNPNRQRLCEKSSRNWRLGHSPGGIGADHFIEGDQQFPGDGDEGDLLGFAGRDQAHIELFQGSRNLSGRPTGEVKSGADHSAAASDVAFAFVISTIGGKGCQAAQRRNFSAIDVAELR